VFLLCKPKEGLALTLNPEGLTTCFLSFVLQATFNQRVNPPVARRDFLHLCVPVHSTVLLLPVPNPGFTRGADWD